MSTDDLDLPLGGGAADLEIRPREPAPPHSGVSPPAGNPAPARIPAPARGAPPATAATSRAAPRPTARSRATSGSSRRGLVFVVASAALVVGALAGWFLKPDPAVAVLSAEMVDFGEVRIATTADGLAVEITNAGESALAVHRVYVEGEQAETFVVAADGCSGQELKAKTGCDLRLTFSPTATGAHQAALVIEGDTPYAPPRLPLLGLGVAPQLEAEPLEINFGEQLMGTTTRRSTIRVENRGSAPLAIQSVTLEGPGAGDFGVRDRCSNKTLAPGERCELAYAFLPTAAGDRRARLRLMSDAGEALAASPELVGQGLARKAALRIEPRRLEFGSQALGQTSAPLKVTLTNGGTANLSFKKLEILPEPEQSGFELRLGACAKRPLRPDRSCAIEVLFVPLIEGGSTAELEIAHDAGGADRRIPLSGTGTVPKIFLDPLVLDFGRTDVGSLSKSKFVQVVNSGTGPLDIKSIRLRGAGAQAFTARPVGCTTAPLKPKSSCSVEVRFKPTRGGSIKSDLVLTHSAVEGSHTIEVRGLGQVR